MTDAVNELKGNKIKIPDLEKEKNSREKSVKRMKNGSRECIYDSTKNKSFMVQLLASC